MIIDLTPVRDRTGPARLLDMVEGRSKQVFKTWLSKRDETWRKAVDVVAMDGFTGFKTAAIEELNDVTVVMDPFHVVRLAGQSLELASTSLTGRLRTRSCRCSTPFTPAFTPTSWPRLQPTPSPAIGLRTVKSRPCTALTPAAAGTIDALPADSGATDARLPVGKMLLSPPTIRSAPDARVPDGEAGTRTREFRARQIEVALMMTR